LASFWCVSCFRDVWTDNLLQLCNAVFAVGALAVLYFRHKQLATSQYVRLVARIGLPNGAV
jgi:hypothetical protein